MFLHDCYKFWLLLQLSVMMTKELLQYFCMIVTILQILLRHCYNFVTILLQFCYKTGPIGDESKEAFQGSHNTIKRLWRNLNRRQQGRLENQNC